MEKILVIRYGTIGDTIFASAFYRELRHALPDARIDILADDISAGVMNNCPYINKIFYLDGKYRNIFAYLSLFRKYDTVYFLKNDSFFSLIAYFAGVKKRIGFDVRRNKFLTLTSAYNEDRHEIDCYLDLLRISGIPVKNDKTEVWLNRINDDKAKEIISCIANKKILIQAFSRFAQKNWLDEYWIELIRFLSNEIGAQIFFVGAEKDVKCYQNILDNITDNLEYPPINMCGKISIAETMSLVKNMDMVIGIDSGVIHMAAALDIPSILLHGPTSLVRWKPRSDKCIVLSRHFSCSPCCLQSGSTKYCKNKVSDCMEYLTPDMVINVLSDKFGLKSKKIA